MRNWLTSVTRREHDIQSECVRWFRLAHPSLAPLLFAVPNGGRRDAITGARLKEEGVLAGVADLILLHPSGLYHGLCIEMKTKTGRQSDAQKVWQSAVEDAGYRYAVVRSVAEFIDLVGCYLRGDRDKLLMMGTNPTQNTK